MERFEAIPIPPDFHLRLSFEEVAAYPPKVVADVEGIWQKISEITDWDLYDGKVFQLKELHSDHMTGVFNDYRYYYAQSCHPELKDEINITLVGVTGVLKCDGKYLLGKRSKTVTQFPLMWEFAPSGGVSVDSLSGETIDYEKQVFEELTQEVGMDWEFITEIKPFLLIWDKEDRVVDICARLSVDPIGMATASYHSPEYIAYEWLSRDEIEEFLKDKDVVPTTKILLDYL